jgi:hypothetical protein
MKGMGYAKDHFKVPYLDFVSYLMMKIKKKYGSLIPWFYSVD